MTSNDFKAFMVNRLAERRRILDLKGPAYSGTGDCFSNFKRNAAVVGVSKYQIWLVYFQKHLDAITNAIKQNPESPVEKSEGMTGRIDDAINYLDLLAGMLEEDRQAANFKVDVDDIRPAGPMIYGHSLSTTPPRPDSNSS